MTIRFVGNIALLPQNIQESIAKSIERFERKKDQVKAVLNLCFSYTSRDEVVTAYRDILSEAQNGRITAIDVSEPYFRKCLQVGSTPEMLVRTSGELRLSDFLQYQTANACFICTPVLWPALSFKDFFWAVIKYQFQCLCASDSTLARTIDDDEADNAQLTERAKTSIENVQQLQKKRLLQAK